MNAEYIEYTLYVVAGIMAGAINTMAGGGSIFTLSTLLFFDHMPVNTANGTNRLGIFFQNLSGTWTFHRSGFLDFRKSLRFVIPSLVGAIVGVSAAVDLDKDTMEKIVGVLMFFMLLSMAYKPKQKPQSLTGESHNSLLKDGIIFFFIGLYGGFVQAGVGLAIIIALNKIGGLSLIRSNAIKMVIILVYTVPVLGVFIVEGHIDWPIAILLAAGQLIGTWLAGKFAVNHPGAGKWMKRTVVVMVLLSIFKTLGLINIIF